MSKLDVLMASITNVSELIRKKEISPVEVLDAFLGRIETVREKINPFITILEKQARRAARNSEEEILKGHYRGPLHGIPLAIKDVFFTEGVKTTFGSCILDDFIPRKSATIVRRLFEAGAIIVGKSNMHEFALGATGLNKYYGHPRNPWNIEHITGGSSSGSAAAIAGSCALLALGTDTGGSIQIPSVLCGIVGLKPTFGRVSKHGVFPLCWSLDHPGPMTRTVGDAAIALTCIAGYDPKDSSSKDLPVPDYYSGLTGVINEVRVGVPDTHYFEKIDPEVKAKTKKAINSFKDLGAVVRSIHIPDLEKASAASFIINLSEAASCLEKFHRTRPNEISDDIRARLNLGALQLATNYIKSQRIRLISQRNFSTALKQVDVLVTPGLSITAPQLNQSTVRIDDDEVPVGVALTHFSRICNLVGLPSISIPVGFSESGLPIGIQIIGRPFEEGLILRVADAFQRSIYQPSQWPALS